MCRTWALIDLSPSQTFCRVLTDMPHSSQMRRVIQNISAMCPSEAGHACQNISATYVCHDATVGPSERVRAMWAMAYMYVRRVGQDIGVTHV